MTGYPELIGRFAADHFVRCCATRNRMSQIRNRSYNGEMLGSETVLNVIGVFLFFPAIVLVPGAFFSDDPKMVWLLLGCAFLAGSLSVVALRRAQVLQERRLNSSADGPAYPYVSETYGTHCKSCGKQNESCICSYSCQ